MTADMRRVLVTGGAGFLGSHLAERLLSQAEVHILDNLSTGSIDNIPLGAVFHPGDICRDEDLAALFASERFDAIVHCAAQTSVAVSMRQPELDWEVNVHGTSRLVRLAEAHNVRRFVLISSGGAIYGETAAPATEAVMPAPASHYGLNKFAAEQVLRVSGLSYAILRPSNIYGPRQRMDTDGGVVAIFAERLLRGEPVELHGDGDQRRDFVHVDDVVAAVELGLHHDDDVIWNVASGVSTSVRELVQLLQALSRSHSEVWPRPRRPGDVYCSVLSPQKLILSGAWPGPTALEDGLARLLACHGQKVSQARGTRTGSLAR